MKSRHESTRLYEEMMTAKQCRARQDRVTIAANALTSHVGTSEGKGGESEAAGDAAEDGRSADGRSRRMVSAGSTEGTTALVAHWTMIQKGGNKKGETRESQRKQ